MKVILALMVGLVGSLVAALWYFAVIRQFPGLSAFVIMPLVIAASLSWVSLVHTWWKIDS